MRHKVVVGFFVYFTLYAIISIPLGLLHVSWNLFFLILNLFHVLLIGGSIYTIVQSKNFPKWSFGKVKAYMKEYRWVIVILVLYLLLYFAIDFSLYWYVNRGATWDQSYYAAKANSAIGSPAILLANPKYGYDESPFTILVNSTITWELFWSYLSVLTKLSVNQVSKIILAPFTYIVVFFTFDTVFLDLKKEKDGFYSRGYLVIFGLFILYTTGYDGLQDEVSKLLFLPWYGNVMISTLFVITTVYLSYLALRNPKYLGLLVLQLFFYTIFSAGGLMYAGLMYPFFIIYWYKNKRYAFKFSKLLVISSCLIFFLLNIVYIISQKNVRWIELNRWTSFYQTIIPIFLFSGFGIFLLYAQKKLTRYEKFFLGLFLGYLALFILEPFVIFLFEWYRFALHRFAVSVMIVFLMYGMIGYITVFKKYKKVMIVGMIPFLLIAQKNYDFFLIKNKDAINLRNVVNLERESSEVIQTADFFNQKVSEYKKPVYYCVYGSDAYNYHEKRFKTIYYEKYIDIGSMLITETKNVYEAYNHTDTVSRDLTIDQFADSNCQYLITDSSALQEFFINKGGVIEYTVQSDILLHKVNIINIEKVKG